jgi:hypothetical protein
VVATEHAVQRVNTVFEETAPLPLQPSENVLLGFLMALAIAVSVGGRLLLAALVDDDRLPL